MGLRIPAFGFRINRGFSYFEQDPEAYNATQHRCSCANSSQLCTDEYPDQRDLFTVLKPNNSSRLLPYMVRGTGENHVNRTDSNGNHVSLDLYPDYDPERYDYGESELSFVILSCIDFIF